MRVKLEHAKFQRSIPTQKFSNLGLSEER